MATEILRPDGNGAVDPAIGFTENGAVNAWECIDEAVADEDTTYISHSGTQTGSFTLAASSLTTETIDSIDVVARVRNETGGGGTVSAGLYLGGEFTAPTGVAHSTSYADYTFSDVAKPGGGAWAVDDLANLELYLNTIEGGAGNVVRTTQAWVVVNYSEAAAATGSKNMLLMGLG